MPYLTIDESEAAEILSWCGWYVSEASDRPDSALVGRLLDAYPKLGKMYGHLRGL